MLTLFISWSGERSRLVASAIADLLPDIIQDVRTWMSDHDIGAGSRWGHELNRHLEGSNFGVLCLTPENLSAPWLLFESGALSKKVEESRVIPYRLNLTATDVPLPLAQFQGVDADELGTKKLIQTLNDALSPPIDSQRLERLYQRWWPDLAQRIAAIPAHPVALEARRSDRELIEEILRLVLSLEKPFVQGSAVRSEFAFPPAWTNDGLHKSAVWKSLYDITEADMARMTDEELDSYRSAVSRRFDITPHTGEEGVLQKKLGLVESERTRRSGHST